MRQNQLEHQAIRFHDEAAPQSAAASRLVAVTACYMGRGRAGDMIALPPRTLLHAGPPLHRKRPLSPALARAVAAAACREGLASNPQDALAMVATGQIGLRPAQDFNVVTTLATVVGRSSMLACVSDRDDASLTAYAVIGAEESPYEPGVAVPLGGLMVERDPNSIGSRLAAAARKCVLRAAENVPDCTLVTALGANGTAVGVQISCLGRMWLSSDELWARFLYPQLRRVDKGILGSGDLLLRCALSQHGTGRLWILDARDRIDGTDNPGGDMVRQIPSGLFAACLSNVRTRHWSTCVPLH
jgi:hypothetical protein